MTTPRSCIHVLPILTLAALAASFPLAAQDFVPGLEVSMPSRLADGEVHTLPLLRLIDHGGLLFEATWTPQEGGGRPLTTGTGASLTDQSSPLTFPRNFNRISGPEATSCFACHSLPRVGGGGDIVANAFVLGQRFDHLTFDPDDTLPMRGSHDENGQFATIDEVANSRTSLSLFGAGYIEMLARQMTAELQAIRDGLAPGQSTALITKGVSFGTLRRDADGSWNTGEVEGLAAPSIASSGADDPPNLIIRPFHQAGAGISLREFANGAFNQHHGIQSSERFGDGTDPDGDGFADEMSRADVTAVTVWVATLEVPGRVIPRHRELERAVLNGERLFAEIGCDSCHKQQLPLNDYGWFFSEPNPYNPPGNAQVGEIEALQVDLNSPSLPQPRLRAENGVTWVPAFTDLKLHDITSGPDDPNREPLDMLHPAGSEAFFAGNSYFLTKKLWGAVSEPPYFHHGKFTTLREAINAHAGEAHEQSDRFRALSVYDQGSIIEFLKTLQILPEGSKALVVDENGERRNWPPAWAN